MKYLIVLLFFGVTMQSVGQSNSTLKTKNALGTWIIDLRPTPTSEPYLKEFVFTKINEKEFEGEFYGTPFTGGLFNTDFDKLYFAFTTADQNNTYFHSGYIEGDKMQALTFCESRKFTLPWKGEKKK